jgi:8-oxo-dGTP diphosphatase
VRFWKATVGTGQGAEYTEENRNKGSYLPIWVDVEKPFLDVKPYDSAVKVIYAAKGASK